MTRKELIDYCLSLPLAYEDYPFDDILDAGAWTVMRHQTNKKSFALIYERHEKLCANLKCEPMKAAILRNVFQSAVPGWHMNKEHWNAVYIDGDVPEQELYDMIQHSYDLIKPKKLKRRK